MIFFIVFFNCYICVKFFEFEMEKVQNIRGNFDDMCNFENIQYKENNVYFFDIVF